VRERAKLIAGNFGIWSETGPDTEIELKIPAANAMQGPRFAQVILCAYLTRNEVSSPIRILSVDDHPTFREGIKSFLADQPDMLLVAEGCNGREAIQQYRTHRPDITLMDLQMPEMNGLQPWQYVDTNSVQLQPLSHESLASSIRISIPE